MSLKLRIVFFLSVVCFAACSEVKARRPISRRYGKEMKASIDRNKLLLDRETTLIRRAIKADSMRVYQSSSEGFWYAYLEKHSEATAPQSGDEIALSYSVKTLGLDTIYEEDEIGEVVFVLDRQDTHFPGIRKAVKQMREGERIRVFFPSSLAYSYLGDRDRIGVNVPVCCDIRLKKIDTNK